MRLYTFSKGSLASQCEAWLQLPWAAESQVEDPLSIAAIGTKFHWLAYLTATGRYCQAVEFLTQYDPQIAGMLEPLFAQFTMWWGELAVPTEYTILGEQTVAFNVKTHKAKLIDNRATRELTYGGLDPTQWVAGTLDLAIAAPDGSSLVVFDFKTGYRPVPADSPQMLDLATALSYTGKYKKVYTCIVTVHPDSCRATPYYELTDADMASRVDTLAKYVNTMCLVRAAPELPLNPGPDCGYCVARVSCPLMAGDLSSGFFTPPVNNAQALYNLGRLGVAKQAITLADASTKGYAAENGGVTEPNSNRVWDKQNSKFGWRNLKK